MLKGSNWLWSTRVQSCFHYNFFITGQSSMAGLKENSYRNVAQSQAHMLIDSDSGI